MSIFTRYGFTPNLLNKLWWNLLWRQFDILRKTYLVTKQTYLFYHDTDMLSASVRLTSYLHSKSQSTRSWYYENSFRPRKEHKIYFIPENRVVPVAGFRIIPWWSSVLMFSIYLVGIPVYYYLLIFNSNNGNSCNQLVSESNYRVDGSALVRVGANEVGCDAQAAHKCDWAACT